MLISSYQRLHFPVAHFEPFYEIFPRNNSSFLKLKEHTKPLILRQKQYPAHCFLGKITHLFQVGLSKSDGKTFQPFPGPKWLLSEECEDHQRVTASMKFFFHPATHASVMTMKSSQFQASLR